MDTQAVRSKKEQEPQTTEELRAVLLSEVLSCELVTESTDLRGQMRGVCAAGSHA